MLFPLDLPEVKEYLETLKGVDVECIYNPATQFYHFNMRSKHCSLVRTAVFDANYAREPNELRRMVVYTLKDLATQLGNDMVRLPRINNYSDYKEYNYAKEYGLGYLPGEKEKKQVKLDPINNDNAGIF